MPEEPELSRPTSARQITSAAVRLAAATAAWLALIAVFDRREGWGGYGIRSFAHWLAWQCSLFPVAAREHVRVARASPSCRAPGRPSPPGGCPTRGSVH